MGGFLLDQVPDTGTGYRLFNKLEEEHKLR